MAEAARQVNDICKLNKDCETHLCEDGLCIDKSELESTLHIQYGVLIFVLIVMLSVLLYFCACGVRHRFEERVRWSSERKTEIMR